MKKYAAQGLWLLLVCFSLSRMGAAEGSDLWPKVSPVNGTPPALQVLVYNYASVSNADLNVAQEVANGIYGSVGIRLEWLDCYFSEGEPKYNPDCRQLKPTSLVLRILPRSQSEGLKQTASALGFAVLNDSGHLAHYASVFYHRVEELSGQRTSSRPVVLGHVMAHEMGHLLLGLRNHSRKGLMAGNWGQAELERANLRALTFTSEQAGEIRARFLERVSARDRKELGRVAEHQFADAFKMTP